MGIPRINLIFFLLPSKNVIDLLFKILIIRSIPLNYD